MKFQNPSNCSLWNKEILTESDLSDIFELVRSIMYDSHDRHLLFKCKECGQLYFYEFHEHVSFSGGGDSHYETYIPVQTEDEIALLSNTTYDSILAYSPRLSCSSGPNGEVSLLWVGKQAS